MEKQKMIEWVGTCDTGISSMTMWCALMGVNGRKSLDLNTPRDISDFRRCYDMVQMGEVTLNDMQAVKKQYLWFAPFIDNWKELALLFEEELDSRLYVRIQLFCKEADSIRYEERNGCLYEKKFLYNK